jgi:proline iminopeptidase
MSRRKYRDRPVSTPKKKEKPNSLFPHIEPYSTGFLDVDNTHKLYWEQSGNPDGIPIIFLHGGPGAGATPTHRRFFDPEYYRIIIFDQRGAGRSQPAACLTNNTTEYLISDMELLRERMSIERWHIFGGSWGCTLALSYAQKHPERVLSLTLRGVFTLEQNEVEWFMYGMKNIFPEAWEEFSGHVKDQNDLLNSYYDLLTSDDRDTCIEAAIKWCRYESACSSIQQNAIHHIKTEEEQITALAMARIEAHYFKYEVIKAEDSLMLTENIDRIRSIPAIIVQGRYDIICPINTAHKLHKLWPEADYVIVPDGGHSALDTAICNRLVEATETVKTLFK